MAIGMVYDMVSKKGQKRSVPPSRLKYEKSHPTVSVRVPRDVYDKLMQMKESTGLSTAHFLKAGLDMVTASAGRAFDLAVEEYKVDYPCASCHRRHMTLHSRAEKDAAAQLMYDAGWADPKCQPLPKPSRPLF